MIIASAILNPDVSTGLLLRPIAEEGLNRTISWLPWFKMVQMKKTNIVHIGSICGKIILYFEYKQISDENI